MNVGTRLTVVFALATLYFGVGFFALDEFGVVGIAGGIFWLLVALYSVLRSRKGSIRQAPDVR